MVLEAWKKHVLPVSIVARTLLALVMRTKSPIRDESWISDENFFYFKPVESLLHIYTLENCVSLHKRIITCKEKGWCLRKMLLCSFTIFIITIWKITMRIADRITFYNTITFFMFTERLKLKFWCKKINYLWNLWSCQVFNEITTIFHHATCIFSNTNLISHVIVELLHQP